MGGGFEILFQHLSGLPDLFHHPCYYGTKGLWKNIYSMFMLRISLAYFCCVHYVITNYISKWNPSNATGVRTTKTASIKALELGSCCLAKTSHIFPMEHNPLYHVLTNYRQLLLYISYNKNNLYMFVTSKCFLVPITMAYLT